PPVLTAFEHAPKVSPHVSNQLPHVLLEHHRSARWQADGGRLSRVLEVEDVAPVVRGRAASCQLAKIQRRGGPAAGSGGPGDEKIEARRLGGEAKGQRAECTRLTHRPIQGRYLLGGVEGKGRRIARPAQLRRRNFERTGIHCVWGRLLAVWRRRAGGPVHALMLPSGR